MKAAAGFPAICSAAAYTWCAVLLVNCSANDDCDAECNLIYLTNPSSGAWLEAASFLRVRKNHQPTTRASAATHMHYRAVPLPQVPQ
jgi:hypothetical protein